MRSLKRARLRPEPKPKEVKPKRAMVRWTDEEWDRLANLVYTMRRNTPELPLTTMANRAQKQFPMDRQRGSLSTINVSPLVERIKRIDRDLQGKAERCDQLAAKITFYDKVPATREELLTTLSDEEIQTHFLSRLLGMLTPADIISTFQGEILVESMATADLVAIAAKRLVTDLTTRPINVTVQMPGQQATPRTKPNGSNGSIASNGSRKKVVVVGTKGDQPRYLREKVGCLAELTFIEAEKLHRDSVPKNVDYLIIWSKFVSHALRQVIKSTVSPQKISEHFSGLTELAELIEGLCRSASKVSAVLA